MTSRLATLLVWPIAIGVLAGCARSGPADTDAKANMGEAIVQCFRLRGDLADKSFDKVVKQVSINGGYPDIKTQQVQTDPVTSAYPGPEGSWLYWGMRVYGACLQDHKKHVAAEDAYKRLIAVCKVDRPFAADLAKIYYDTGDFATAKQYYKKELDRLLMKDQNTIPEEDLAKIYEVREAIIDCCRRLKDPDTALSLATQNYQSAPSGEWRITTMADLASEYLAASRWEEAAELLEQIQALKVPKYAFKARAHIARASAQLAVAKKDYKEANYYYTQAVECATSDSSFWSDAVTKYLQEQLAATRADPRTSPVFQKRLTSRIEGNRKLNLAVLYMQSKFVPKDLGVAVTKPLLESATKSFGDAGENQFVAEITKMKTNYEKTGKL